MKWALRISILDCTLLDGLHIMPWDMQGLNGIVVFERPYSCITGAPRILLRIFKHLIEIINTFIFIFLFLKMVVKRVIVVHLSNLFVIKSASVRVMRFVHIICIPAILIDSKSFL